MSPSSDPTKQLVFSNKEAHTAIISQYFFSTTEYWSPSSACSTACIFWVKRPSRNQASVDIYPQVLFSLANRRIFRGRETNNGLREIPLVMIRRWPASSELGDLCEHYTIPPSIWRLPRLTREKRLRIRRLYIHLSSSKWHACIIEAALAKRILSGKLSSI